jgi:hypothetical protein
VLRCESIINGHDQAPGVSRQAQAPTVSDVEIAKNEAATVNLQKRSAHAATNRFVETNIHGPSPTSDRLVSNLDLMVPVEFRY